jgi:hypothetical protein
MRNTTNWNGQESNVSTFDLHFEVFDSKCLVHFYPMFLCHFEDIDRTLDAALDRKELEFFENILRQIFKHHILPVIPGSRDARQGKSRTNPRLSINCSFHDTTPWH